MTSKKFFVKTNNLRLWGQVLAVGDLFQLQVFQVFAGIFAVVPGDGVTGTS